jgi:hypothetical protein
MGMYGGAMTPYQRPIGSMGTRLSPEAAEFSVDLGGPTPWNTQVSLSPPPKDGVADLMVEQPTEAGSQYVSPAEPMNYRRLLDRNMNCNWKYIVDKIICNNDQQASIFLQQVINTALSPCQSVTYKYTEAQGRHRGAEVRDRRSNHCSGISAHDQPFRQLSCSALLRAWHARAGKL